MCEPQALLPESLEQYVDHPLIQQCLHGQGIPVLTFREQLGLTSTQVLQVLSAAVKKQQ